jgi:carboxyl-terminal processing protease
METNGLYFSPGAVPNFSTIEAFKAYLIDRDPYADFLTRDEYLQFKNAQGERYAGIGLEIERDRSGTVLCFPDPAGPAANAGVLAGDTLLSIDGRPARGRPLPTLVAWAAGTPGSQIVIDVATQDKRARRVAIVRRSVVGPSVTDRQYGPRDVVRIASFTPNTRQELEFILSNRHTAAPLIVDLRGNRGGDLNAAIDSAMLFLKRGELVALVREKKAIHRYVSTLERPPYPGTPFLWQDSGTASSAELFIAALTDNGRGVSVGQKTFGKGTKQDLIELGSGAVLIVTTGYLLTPGGKDIEGHGLAPGAEVSGTGTDQPYFDAVIRLSTAHH